ncbi:MAG: hypothetical protein AAB386_04295 [Patescibacteria group bacterium]
MKDAKKQVEAVFKKYGLAVPKPQPFSKSKAIKIPVRIIHPDSDHAKKMFYEKRRTSV